MALASAVLPQPGGPCSSTPRGGSTPSHPYTCGGEGRRESSHGLGKPAGLRGRANLSRAQAAALRHPHGRLAFSC
jgi:hypothetical protein